MIGLARASDDLRAAMGRYGRAVVLDDDYPLLLRRRREAPPGTRVEGLGKAFDRLYERLHVPLARALAQVGQGVRPEVWWSGQVASRSSTAVNVMRNLIYAHYAREIVAARPAEDVLFVCADAGLARCLARMLRERGVAWRDESPVLARLGARLRSLGGLAARAAWCVREFVQTSRLAKRLPAPAGLEEAQPRTLLRTWIPEGAFGPDGRFADRTFGALPAYLRRRGYDVVFLPMLVDLRRGWRAWLGQMAASGERFLVPHHLVGLGSLAGMLALEARRLCVRFRGVRVEGLDVSAILGHETRTHAFDPSMVRLNLVYPLLWRLAARGVRVDAVAYPFENNAPEKMLLLAARRFYPGAETVGFQHSVWLSRQAGAELAPGEAESHPLPDRIVCSGGVYPGVLAGLNFPAALLGPGPSLRFAFLREYAAREAPPRASGRPPVLFLALPYDRDMSYELIDKLRAAVGGPGAGALRVAIKPHPLLDEAALRDFVRESGPPGAEIVGGTVRENLLAADVALAIGTSVVHLEAVAAGVPLVRVVPENTFFLDPMKWMAYPIGPARTPEEIRAAVAQALAMTPEALASLAAEVKRDWFEEATDRTMAAFVAGRAGEALEPGAAGSAPGSGRPAPSRAEADA